MPPSLCTTTSSNEWLYRPYPPLHSPFDLPKRQLCTQHQQPTQNPEKQKAERRIHLIESHVEVLVATGIQALGLPRSPMQLLATKQPMLIQPV